MFNILPDNFKEALKSEYKIRKVIVILTLTLCLELVFLIMLFPSWLISYNKEKDMISQSEDVEKSSVVANLNSITSTISGTNTKLKILSSSLEYPKVVPLIKAIISKETNNIQINAMMYTFVDINRASISLQGISLTREALVAFQKSLQNSGVFQSVDLPVSNLAKDRNLNFSMSLTIGTTTNEKR